MKLPYVTGDLPGIGGLIKQRPEDFFVQEIPLYEPSGEGEHVYCEIQKIGITTFAAVDRIARALRVDSREIGYAGMKDARAISRQTLSIRGVEQQAVMDLKLPQITFQWAARHGNKLRLGHLKANRFAIKIRDVNPTDVVKLQPLVERLGRVGMPNYFGPQRFGMRNDNDRLGAALIAGDDRQVLGLLLGTPDPSRDDPQSMAARKAFDAHDLHLSMKHWPRRCGLERRVLHRLIKSHKPSSAVRAVDQKLRRLWISALQSRLFNLAVAHRIDALDRILEGDLAYKHENGACFLVTDPAAEQVRADAFEISATGPLVGYRMSHPQGRAAEIEQEVFAAAHLQPGDFRRAGSLKIKGARRPIRVRPEDLQLSAGVDEDGGYITVAFTLPAGSFATVLIDELTKTGADGDADGPAEDDGERASAELADNEADDQAVATND